ncbi:hypothetical protein GCM10007928_30780 [Sulfitobacter porphyrae]|nr:hypothetical protein GCM10007928_30780 [Sulfitobacter porphyrae]
MHVPPPGNNLIRNPVDDAIDITIHCFVLSRSTAATIGKLAVALSSGNLFLRRAVSADVSLNRMRADPVE